MLVLEVPEGDPRVSTELWLNPNAQRFMLWGRFDDLIVAQLAAKELRAQVRQKGIIAASEKEKALVLRRYVEDRRHAKLP